tara:strand:- start:235 stop:819 length:585 start_codon:yes stop_codon:yes gene_type:complete
MSDIIHPFQIPIYQSFIDNNSFIQIKKDVLAYINNNKEEFKRSWDCPTLSTVNSDLSLESVSLKNELKKSTEIYFKEWGFKGTYNLKFSNIWINISPKGSFQESHKHGEYFKRTVFSGVLYINTSKDSGDLTLVNPIEDQLLLGLPSQKIIPRLKIPPEDRKIIYFPSWMDHFVGENKNNQDRISVSWNIEIKN